MKSYSLGKYGAFLLFPLILIACSRPSDAFQQPNMLQLLTEIDPIWDPIFSKQLESIRVKIFPHHSAYNAPHKREKVLSRFAFTSKGECNLYLAESGSSADGISRQNLVTKGSSFSFTTDNFNGPYWLECEQPATLHREGIDTKTSYSGVFFIKKISSRTSSYLTVVNVLPFEEYLRGVVPAEMPASWSKEALKAQAVAARTYAYFEVVANVAAKDPNIVREASGAQLDDTVSYQAYLGNTVANANTNEALRATEGQLMVHNGKIVKAFFHADSGGHTEDSKNVWGIALPYIIGKPEIYAPGSVPGSTWRIEITHSNVQRALIARKLLPSTAQVEGLWIHPQDILPSTRPALVSITLKTGEVRKVAAVDFAYAMGLKSSWIQFIGGNSAKGSIAIEGKGYGHGAGMNQWGARIMADQFKKTYEEILHFYYTNVEITR